ncbi:MAG: Carnitine transport binding protein OpuCC [Chlamydiae bacterium]|nr:Carnitine transport binding protein OpuCC [Chlamydiota bacterium]
MVDGANKMKQLKIKLKSLFLYIVLLIFLLAFSIGFEGYRGKQSVVIGAKNCTEQHILAEMLASLVQQHTDLKVKRCFNLEGTTICFNALKSGTIDAYFEYTGTALLDILKEPLIEGPLFEHVKAALEQKYDLLLLDPLGFSNQYVLIARSDSNLKKISDIPPNARIAFDPEFAARPEVDLLKQKYPWKWKTKLMDQVLLYFSLQNKVIDVMSGFSTDGRLKDPRFVILEDDRKVLPPYMAAPLIRKKTLEKFPEMEKIFSLLNNCLTDEQMIQLNYKVESLGCDVTDVVQEFLQNAKLLK